MPRSRRPTPEISLAQAAHVRELADAICRDAELAREVEQSTWVAALERFGAERSAPTRWLAKTVKNLARTLRRSSARRTDRETRAARTEALPSTDELCARAEFHRELVERVTELDEPERTAILLRWFEGLTSREIAERIGVSVEVVYARLAVGLRELRASLSRRDLGGAVPWSVFVANWNRWSSLGGLAKTGTVIVKTRIVVAAVFVVLVGLGWRMWSARSASTSSAANAATAPVALAPSNGTSLADGELATPSSGETSRDAVAHAPDESKGVAAAPALEIRGQVVDSFAHPIAGASIEAFFVPARGFELIEWKAGDERQFVARTSSNEQGEFRIALAHDVQVDLEVSAAGYASIRDSNRRAGEDLRIELQAGARLSGRIHRAESDEALAGARISLRLYQTDFGAHSSPRVATSDEAGRFVLTNLLPGSYSLNLEHNDACPLDLEHVEIAEGESRELDFALERGATLRGRVLGADDRAPVADAQVDTNRTFDHAVRTNADGRFELHGITTSGNFYVELFARAAGHSIRTIVLDGSTPRESDFEFLLPRGHSIRGAVLGFNAHPLADAYIAIVAHPDDSSGSAFENGLTRSAVDGTFEFEDLEPDACHTLVVRAPGYAMRALDVPESEHILEALDLGDIELREPSRISGRVIDQDGKPVAQAAVTLNGANSDRSDRVDTPNSAVEHYFAERNARTDADGRFRFDDVAGGTYTVQARTRTLASSELFSVWIPTGEVRDDVVLALDRKSHIAGRVVDEGGRPLSMVSVEAYPETANGLELSKGGPGTDADGRFRIDALEPGTYTIHAELFGEDAGRDVVPFACVRGVHPDGDELQIVLGRTLEIRGRVIAADGSAIRNCLVGIDEHLGGWFGGTSMDHTDADGHFRLRAGARGMFDLVAIDQNASPTVFGRALGVTAGATDVVIELPNGR